MKTASEMASWIAKTIENNSPETAAIIIMEEYNCNPYASHPSPMSAEQVEELGYYYPLFKFFSDEHGLSLLDSQLQDVIHECKKFIEPASPSVKADVVKTPHPDKPFIVANVRDIIEGFEMRGDYSYSRMTEMFNDATFQWMGKQELVKADGWVRFEDKKPDTGKLILVSWPSDITPEIRRLTEDDLKDDWSDMKWIYIPEWLPAPPKQQ